jgi:hypothetical protein
MHKKMNAIRYGTMDTTVLWSVWRAWTLESKLFILRGEAHARVS